MIRKRLIRLMLVALPIMLFSLDAGSGFAQDQTKPPAPSTNAADEIIKGTIDFYKNLGGYFIRGEEPGGELFIVNQNQTVLKKLKTSGKTVTIQGHTTEQGAEYFFIESIDGKKYTEAKKKKTSPAGK
jgi:hypothetical protein